MDTRKQSQAAQAGRGAVDIEANKATVTAFYDLMFNQSEPAEAVPPLCRRQLHPAQPDGRGWPGGLHRVLSAMAREYPGSTSSSGGFSPKVTSLFSTVTNVAERR